MNVISSLDSSTFLGVVACALIAALITALIHSSSATIGIVMGLGAAGVLEWQTAIAFAIGADLGTTITSWIASLNLSKNAKRTAYAHIAFNFIGVCVVLVLFFPAIQVLTWVMGFFGGDPGVPVTVDGEETFPLVPVAVGLFSIFFNIFNVLILFPFVGTFERVLMRIGHKGDDVEDYSLPKYLDRKVLDDFNRAVPAMRHEVARALEGSRLFLDSAKGKKSAMKKTAEHSAAIDALSREIRAYSAQLFTGDRTREQMDLVASMIEEADFTGSLTEALHQIARRIQREEFSAASQEVLDKGLGHLDLKLSTLEGHAAIDDLSIAPEAPVLDAPEFEAMRWTVIDADDIPAAEKGALLALLGSMERAEALIDRIAQERASVDRDQASVLSEA
jgi:phosphate:Na+ symporter